MKLTKRGKKARALFLLGVLVLSVRGVEFVATHHTEKGECKYSADAGGMMCGIIWVKN